MGGSRGTRSIGFVLVVGVFAVSVLTVSFFGMLEPCAALAEGSDQDEVKYDYVTDTVTGVVQKASLILMGQIDVTTETGDKPSDYTVDAIGRRVPRQTAVKAGGGLHNDQPLR